MMCTSVLVLELHVATGQPPLYNSDYLCASAIMGRRWKCVSELSPSKVYFYHFVTLE